MHFSYRLDEQFSVKECTYVSDDKGVIYSPANSETIMCDKKVVDLIKLIEDSALQESIEQLLKNNPLDWEEIIRILLNMHVFYETE